MVSGCAHTPMVAEPLEAKHDTSTALQQEYREIALQNVCPEGVQRLQGTWKFVGETKTPNFQSIFTVKGTSYEEVLQGNPDGAALRTDVTGEVRCLFKNRVLMMVDKVNPEGGFGNRSGESYPCDILDSMQKEQKRVLLICFFDWDLRPSKGLSFEYEKVSP